MKTFPKNVNPTSEMSFSIDEYTSSAPKLKDVQQGVFFILAKRIGNRSRALRKRHSVTFLARSVDDMLSQKREPNRRDGLFKR